MKYIILFFLLYCSTTSPYNNNIPQIVRDMLDNNPGLLKPMRGVVPRIKLKGSIEELLIHNQYFIEANVEYITNDLMIELLYATYDRTNNRIVIVKYITTYINERINNKHSSGTYKVIEVISGEEYTTRRNLKINSNE